MTREQIERTKLSNGFNGKETERDLLLYVISKLDDHNDKNTEQHAPLSEATVVCNRDLATNKQHIKYIKLGMYGLGVTILFILNTIFSII